MAQNLSIFDAYPEMSADDQGHNANALFGLLMEKEIMFQPSNARPMSTAMRWTKSTCPTNTAKSTIRILPFRLTALRRPPYSTAACRSKTPCCLQRSNSTSASATCKRNTKTDGAAAPTTSAFGRNWMPTKDGSSQCLTIRHCISP